MITDGPLAASVGEGQLVPFTLSASPAPAAALTVKVSVADSGSFLTGTIPPDLGWLDGLEVLQLNDNQLTGEIPAALGSLADLQSLYLGRNQLTGCIPPALRNVDDNDLDSLGLQDCATP